jgi:hypothetical protein
MERIPITMISDVIILLSCGFHTDRPVYVAELTYQIKHTGLGGTEIGVYPYVDIRIDIQQMSQHFLVLVHDQGFAPGEVYVDQILGPVHYVLLDLVGVRLWCLLFEFIGPLTAVLWSAVDTGLIAVVVPPKVDVLELEPQGLVEQRRICVGQYLLVVVLPTAYA